MNAPDHFLRRAHRRARLGPLVWSLALAVLACAFHLSASLGWRASVATPAALVLAATSAVVLFIGLRRARRLSAESLARRLDTEWSLAARLESSAELAADSSAFARAQRADAARHILHRPAPGSIHWRSALGLLTLSLLILVVESSILGLRLLRPAPLVAQPAALAPDITAAFTWKSPESEIKATAIEEIPLAAAISTRTGLRSLTLEVAVNGESRLSRPLDAATLAALARPGDHAIELPLYLDEVGAQEFDLVSYHLRGERATTAASPVVTSALQFIQIRPPREDVLRLKSLGGPSSVNKLAVLLGNLKAAQLQLLKQNFLLAHAQFDHSLPVWREENTRVAADQKLLAQKTAEARDYAIGEALPSLVVDNLGQCIPLMDTAAARITAAANESAAAPQGQVLGLLVATEKLLRKVIMEGGGSPASQPAPKNHDPFKDKQTFKLPPRADTPAGQLEQLAQAQAETAQAAPGKNPLAEQAELAAKLAALAAAKSLDPAAQPKTEQAARDAAEALRQLQQGDAEAARAPAASAAQALREATAAQEAAGRAAARAELEKIRRELNAAEHFSDPATIAAARAEAAAKLRAEASAQQQTGSAEAARQLAEAAAQADQAAKTAAGKGEGQAPQPAPSPGEGSSPGESSGRGKDGKPAPSPGEGSSPGETPGQGEGPSASAAAARAQAALTPRDQALALAIRQLSRAGKGNTPSPGGAPDAELGAQLAEQLLSTPADRSLARDVADGLRHTSPNSNGNTIAPADLGALADKLVLRLEAARSSGLRDEQIRRFNPDDFDPAYREAVEAYFEKLSRDAAK